MIDITEQALDPLVALTAVTGVTHGAVASFVGTIRNYNLGKSVVSVHYDIHVALAEKIFKDLCKEVLDQWGTCKVYLAHRYGKVAVGEISVIVAVGAVHRAEALNACQYLIEAIKHRCPIWKQEQYVDGCSEWVKGHALCAQ